MRFVPTTYSTWVRTDVLFDIQILRTIGQGQNRLCERKLEVATRSSYTSVKLMSELWRFVYIVCHVTLHAKPDAQKVNCTPLGPITITNNNKDGDDDDNKIILK